MVTVKIYGSDIASGGCCGGSGCCGDSAEAQAPFEEQAEKFKAALMRYYGDQVRVEHVDIFSDAMETHPDVLEAISKRGLPLPLVTINDEPRFAGGMPLDGVSEAIEELGVKPLASA